MKLLLLVVIVLGPSIQVDVPFKNADEFQVKVDLKFKNKPFDAKAADQTYNSSGERIDKPKAELMAFLVVNITDLKVLPDEARIQVIDSKGSVMLRKKTSPAPEPRIEMGFVDDLKKGEAAHEVTVYFLSAEKKELRKIVCTVQQDGTFLVNGKWNGKF